jgi:hypothetical protein
MMNLPVWFFACNQSIDGAQTGNSDFSHRPLQLASKESERIRSDWLKIGHAGQRIILRGDPLNLRADPTSLRADPRDAPRAKAQ